MGTFSMMGPHRFYYQTAALESLKLKLNLGYTEGQDTGRQRNS